jgi:signal transduction histidine kinase
MASDRESRSRAAAEHFSSVPASQEILAAADGMPVADTPAKWLDRLLVASAQLPIAEGEARTCEALVGVLSDLLPEYGIGACLAPDDGAEQIVFKVTPDGEDHRGLGTSPTRLFPGYSHERIVDVEGNGAGSTLHIAADDPCVEDESSALGHLIARAALVMNRGLDLARTHARATSATAELRALNSHMMQAEKLASLGQIAAGVVHELNNPLTSIVAYTDYLLRKTRDEDDVNRLRRIGESAERMLRFTRDLVTYARPSSEVAVAVTIHNVIDQALAFCEHVLAEAGSSIERRFVADLPPVRGMPSQLAQVFVNLVTNACHAMPHGLGKLVITTRAAEDRQSVVVWVDDNGHGIAQEHLPHIFAPFFTTKGEGRGTGLGLSIVKNIIDKHEGEIRAERLFVGGTRFVLRLPTKPRTIPAPPL